MTADIFDDEDPGEAATRLIELVERKTKERVDLEIEATDLKEEIADLKSKLERMKMQRDSMAGELPDPGHPFYKPEEAQSSSGISDAF